MILWLTELNCVASVVSMTFRLTVEEIQIITLLKSYWTNVIPINIVVLCTHVAYNQNLKEDLDDIIISEAFDNILKIISAFGLTAAI